MAKLFLAFGLFAYLSTASIDGSTCDEGGCTERCSHDDSDGQCPANCSDCGCPHLNLLVVAADVKVLQLPAPPAPELKQAAPPSPEPGDILHVPKTLLA